MLVFKLKIVKTILMFYILAIVGNYKFNNFNRICLAVVVFAF